MTVCWLIERLRVDINDCISLISPLGIKNKSYESLIYLEINLKYVEFF